MGETTSYRWCAVLATLGMLLLAGCGGLEDRAPSSGRDKLAHRLEQMPGMRTAEVHTESGVEEEEDEVYWKVVVDAEADATADNIADVLDQIESADELADQVRGVVYLDAGSTRWSDRYSPAYRGVWTTDGDATTDARRFIAAVRRFADATVTVDSHGLMIRLDSGGPDAVTAAARALLADPQLTGNAAVSISGEGGSLSSGKGRLTASLVDSFARAAAALDILGPQVKASVSVAVDSTPSVMTTVRLPGNVAPARLTSERYGARLWPLIHAQLDVLRRDPELDSLRVTNLYDEPAGGRTDAADVFCTAYEGSTPAPDAHGRTWGREATAYLNR